MLIDRTCPICGQRVDGYLSDDNRIVYNDKECEDSAFVETRVKCSYRGSTKKVQYVHKHCLYKNKRQGGHNK